MKTTVIYILLFICVSATAMADVLIVDNKGNSPSGANIYSTVSSAISAALSGDTILVTPSTASYGNVSISKPITLMGVGWNAPTANNMYSTVANVIISAGINDITISGLVITGYISIGSSAGTVSNVIIEKNKINYITTSANTLSNILISGNFIYPQISTYCINLVAANQSNILIQNNIISKPVSNFGPLVSTGGVTFDHNLFADNGGSRNAFYSLTNCTVSNNIFYGSNPTPSTGSTINFENNLSFGASSNVFPTGAGYTNSGNQEGVDPLFVDFAVGYYDTSKDVNLSGGSPAIGAGTDATDLGIYGGSTPFKDSGVSLPVVKKLQLPTSVVQGTNTDATIEVSGN